MQHAFAWPRAVLAGLVLVPALALTAAPAMAQGSDGDLEVRHLAINYHDLDLATAKGRARLETRLERAAAIVCGFSNGDRPWHGDTEGEACFNTALAHAHTELAARQTSREVVTR